MPSKLRPLYDKLYMGIDVGLLALGTARDYRRRAAGTEKPDGLDRAYAEEIRPFWKRFRTAVPAKYWFRVFGTDPRFIPDDMWYRRIVPHFSTLLFSQALQDKCMHNLFVPGIKRPRTIVKNVAGRFCADDLSPLARDEAADRCVGAGRLIVKPSVGSGQGHDVRFFDSTELSRADVEEIFRQYGKNFIVQEKMSQHPVLASLNPRSLNTIRIMSFYFRDRVHLLSSILRVGGGQNEMDNVSQGGFQITIRPDGSLEPLGITRRDGVWKQVDRSDGGTLFEGVTVPSFERAASAVRSCAEKMPHFGIIGWDIAVDPEGDPVLIEYNVIPGQNQGTCGPTFGDMTEDVLAEVFGRR